MTNREIVPLASPCCRDEDRAPRRQKKRRPRFPLSTQALQKASKRKAYFFSAAAASEAAPAASEAAPEAASEAGAEASAAGEAASEAAASEAGAASEAASEASAAGSSDFEQADRVRAAPAAAAARMILRMIGILEQRVDHARFESTRQSGPSGKPTSAVDFAVQLLILERRCKR